MGFLFYPKLTHPSTCIVHAEYHNCVTVYRSDVQYEKQSDHNFDTYGFLIFSPEIICVHQIQIIQTSKLRLHMMMYLQA